MRKKIFVIAHAREFLLILLSGIFFITAQAQDSLTTSEDADSNNVNVEKIIFEHLADSYSWHLLSWGDKHYEIPLPIIVFNEGKVYCFLSNKLSHSKEYKGFYISQSGTYHGKLVKKNAKGEEFRPFDLSITKNVLAILLSSLLLVITMLLVARHYRRLERLALEEPHGKENARTFSHNHAPIGLAALFEPLIMLIHNDLAKKSIGEDYRRYSPYLCTVFFWILFNNLLGLVPFFPGGANITGNIAVTMVLALCTFIAINFFGTKHYYKEIFWPDVPVFLKFPIPIMPAIELFSMLLKPLSLMIRLFANMLAGHILLLSLVCIIFIMGKYGVLLWGGMSIFSILFSIFMNLIELLVAFIQAYVFTLLSSVFIGFSRQKE